MADHPGGNKLRLLVIERNLIALVAIEGQLKVTVSPFLAGSPWPSISVSILIPDLILIAPLASLKGFFEYSLFPLHRIADDDFTIGDDSRIGAAAPAGVHRILQARQNFVHPFAGLGLATDS